MWVSAHDHGPGDTALSSNFSIPCLFVCWPGIFWLDSLECQAAAGASVGRKGGVRGESIGHSRPGDTFTQLHLLPSHCHKHAPWNPKHPLAICDKTSKLVLSLHVYDISLFWIIWFKVRIVRAHQICSVSFWGLMPAELVLNPFVLVLPPPVKDLAGFRHFH